MQTIISYQRHAEECDALAKAAISEEQRQMIARMAESWRLLARERERYLASKSKIEDLDVAGSTGTPKAPE